MSRRVQPSCRRTRPSLQRGRLLRVRRHRANSVRGRSRARGAGSRMYRQARSPRLQPLLPRGRRAGSTRRLQPSAGAEPRPTRWSPVSHLPWLSGPRRAARGPCSPGAGHLPLEPHFSLSFLTCSRLSPVLSLTPKWPSTSSTVFVCAFSMTAGARPASPPVPAASSPPPRTRAAGSCHPGRPGADWPLPPPPPPAAASASPGAESPRAPSPRQPPLRLPGPRLCTPRAQLGGGGLLTLPPLVRREGLLCPQPPAGNAGRGPRTPSPLS